METLLSLKWFWITWAVNLRGDQPNEHDGFIYHPDVLEAMINTALETQDSALRDELRALVPNLESVKRQQVQMLSQQALQGDMLAQVQDSLDAALAFNASLAVEGIVGAQIATFLAARGRFQSALPNGDLAVLNKP